MSLRPRWRARMLGLALAWAPGGLVAGAPAAAAAAPPPLLGGVLGESRLLYPLQVGDWKAVGEQRFSDQRLGVSVRYVDGERWIDLHFRPLGPHAARLLEHLAAAERAHAATAAREAGREVRLGELQALALPGAPGSATPAWWLGLEYPDDRHSSALVLFARNLYLVRARASAPAPASAAALAAELLAFAGAVDGQLHIASTGGCWLPGRIELVDALPAAPAPQVLASYRAPGRAASAAVTAAGVQVVRSEAGRAPQLAAELAAALYPGCVAPEAIEPEVPPYLREIRIEYRLPANGTPGRRSAPVGRPRSPLRGTG